MFMGNLTTLMKPLELIFRMPIQDIDFFKQALEAANTGIWEWNIRTNQLFWTDRVREIYNIEKNRKISMEVFTEQIHPDDRAMVHEKIQQAMHPDFKGHYHITHRIIGGRDGKIRWVEGFGKVYFDDQGAPAIFTGTVHDVTDIKAFELERTELLKREQEARQEAFQQKEKIESLFLKSPIPIAVVQGPRFKYLLANDPYCRMIAMNKDLRGLTIDDVFPNQAPEAVQILTDVLNTGKRFTAHEHRVFSDWYRTGQKVEKFFDVVYEQFPGDCLETTLVMIMATDVTEQVLHRRSSEEANSSKSRFIANVSHEIRTPLGIILGFTDLALEHNRDEAITHYLLTIQRNGQLLNRIVGEVLDLSKIEANRLELENVNFSIREMLEEVITFLQLSAREKAITLSLDIESNVPDIIETDPTRLRQIVINLVGNAIKFTDRGHVAVTAQWLESGLFQLRVEDTGIGITPEQQEKLFQPFSQADTSMARRFGGTGLGLLLAKQLSQALGGDLILANSTLQVGSVFVCTIKPVSAKRNISQKSVSQQKAQVDISLANIKVLVVDDSEDNRFLLCRILQTTGAITSEADNGQNAVKSVLENNFDVILMDLQMPIMDGREATRFLREKGITTPIVALTAHALKEERQKALQEGFTDYLTKPINRELLLRTISKLRNYSIVSTSL